LYNWKLIALSISDEWFKEHQACNDKPFKHGSKPGWVTVVHPSREISLGTLRNIKKQSGLKLT